MEKTFFDFCVSLLNTDEGISDEAFGNLQRFAMDMDYASVLELLEYVEATDGQNYLPVDFLA
jgi:hypothetical protein